jgi:hypothetical protein
MGRSPAAKTATTLEQAQLREVLMASPQARHIEGVLIGRFIGPDAGGRPLVDIAYPGFTEPIRARSAVRLAADAVGREVAVLFEQGHPECPLVIGLIQSGVVQPVSHARTDAEIDGERLVFTAQKEIVLRCGQASITLTRAGKVLIRGAYVLSRSSGVNRIKGGSIQLN